ncbi:MAG: hypothetical protein H0W61_11810 [Bacteroidetes bacterium]|nr:hypothetical protein [Bacteroidota bacterium]
MSFDYLELGDLTTDDGWVEYSTNGGVTWALLVNTAKTLCCGGACTGSNQGKWGNYTSAILPASANNIANFRLRFVWQNNDDAIGKDPSFAINDLKISYNTVLPIELLNFTANQIDNTIMLQWASASEKNFREYEIQKSTDGVSFNEIGIIKAAGNNQIIQKYAFSDTNPFNGLVYYRLKMVDLDDLYKYSELVWFDWNESQTFSNSYFVDSKQQLTLNKSFISSDNFEFLVILNLDGKIISKYKISEHISDGWVVFPCNGLENGIYLCQLTGYSSQKSFKIVVLK